MFITANPHADAEAWGDKQDADEARQESDLARWQEIIKDGFADFDEVPYLMGTCTAGFKSFDDAASDLVGEQSIWVELLTVLKTSECPKIKALLASMQAKWRDLWADVLTAEAEPAWPPRTPVLKLVPKSVFAEMGLPEVEFPSLQKGFRVQHLAADDTEGGAA